MIPTLRLPRLLRLLRLLRILILILLRIRLRCEPSVGAVPCPAAHNIALERTKYGHPDEWPDERAVRKERPNPRAIGQAEVERDHDVVFDRCIDGTEKINVL